MEPITIIVIIISIFCILLILYLTGIKLQIRDIKRQLECRNQEQTEGIVHLEMQDKAVRDMVVILNQTLKQEAGLRRNQNMQENEFRKLITNISHDLRTPLTVMKGYLQLLERCKIDETGKEYLAICFRHTDDLERRIRQFFEYSYWMNQEAEVKLHSINVTNIILNTMTDFIPVFEERGISMRLEDDTIYKAMGEEELLKRVMQNLLKNCLQFADGEVRVLIRAEHADKKRIRVCVQNPVAEAFRPDTARVFQRFYTGNEARSQSTGLGLSIVKLLVEQMGGEVFAAQEEDQFYVGFLLDQA